MPFKKLHIDCYDASDEAKISVHVKRFDGLVLDADGVFKDSPEKPYIELKPGTGLEQSVFFVDVDLDPAQFKDGDYRLYFHDMSSDNKRVFYESEVTVFDGSADSVKTPTVTDIAMRIMNINRGVHHTDGTLGQFFNQQNEKINAIYDWVSKQPGFAKNPQS